MNPLIRKFALTAHIVFSVGWLGAVASFLALAVAGFASQNIQLVRGLYLAMELTGWYVIVPFCLASLISGIVQGLGTKWGLLSYYWVLYKLLITIVSTLILFAFTKTLTRLGELAADATVSVNTLRNPSPVVHASLAVLALAFTTILSVYKPWGKTGIFGSSKPKGRNSGQTQSEATETIKV